jgi:hypothetical protein
MAVVQLDRRNGTVERSDHLVGFHGVGTDITPRYEIKSS